MSYGWENSDQDEHATDAVARGGSLIRDKLLKELEASKLDYVELWHLNKVMEKELEAKNKLIAELKELILFKDKFLEKYKNMAETIFIALHFDDPTNKEKES